MDLKEQTTQSLSSGISGVVKSIDNIILSNARVSCNGVETRTLADGTFTINDLKPGTYDITIDLQGYDALIQSVSIDEEETTKRGRARHKACGNCIQSLRCKGYHRSSSGEHTAQRKSVRHWHSL